MSEQERDQQALESQSDDAQSGGGDDRDDDDEAPSPFDHPAFLPVLLWGLALWFGYDGWFNPEIEAVDFNRYGFAVLVIAASYYTVQAVREIREARASEPD